MFEEVTGLPDQQKLEAEALAFWRERRIFEQLRARNRGGPRFSFLDGPITANNPMGVHHAWGRTLKDMVQRYWAMRGRDQRYQNGFDCQGLWVEVEVERELGFTSKRDIEHYGIAEFVQRCKERAARYAEVITNESIRLGCWMDWDHSYHTLSDENNYAIWHFLKRCHQRGLIYPGEDVMPWCPRCGTGISQQEMAEGYQEVVHPGVVLKMPLAGRTAESLLVWTTTPWTLTANVACAVHPDLDYLRVRQGDETYYLAAARAGEVLSAEPWRAEAKLVGRELVGLRYRGPFDDLPLQSEASRLHRVISWDQVSESEGTGIVHIAPGCGKEDYELGRAEGLPVVAPVDEEGRFLTEAGPLAGLRAEEAEPVLDALRRRGLLYRADDYRHSYPHCWRCGSELLFHLVDEWFIAMDPWREEIMRLAERVTWIPAYGREVELDWLRNMRDWMISKKRYWGLALPIWRCGCGWFDVIGGRDELRERAIAGWEQFDGCSPHRPWVDAVRIRCQRCGGPASRIPEVGNPWLDAGIVPYSTMGYLQRVLHHRNDGDARDGPQNPCTPSLSAAAHYPDARHPVEDRPEWERWFPAELVIECLPGQFRNWFYVLLAMSAMLEGREPIRTVVGHSLVVDEQGEEMHKSKGNAIWFAEAAEAMGGDLVRWLSVSQPLPQPMRFGYGRAEEVRSWLRTLWNVYSFFAIYANVDKWPWASKLDEQAVCSRPLDRWLRARLAQTASAVAQAVETYQPPAAAAALLQLLDDLSNWWVRRSRRRFWKSASDADKQAAYRSLHDALMAFARLLAPILPFSAEALYQRLARPFADQLPESVHLCTFPEPATDEEDRPLLEECERARAIVRLGRAAREKAGLRVRQPLACATVFAEGAALSLPHFEQDVRDELNVKRLTFTSHRSALGDVFAEERGLAVGLEVRLTDELIAEGLARDLVRQVQNLRRKAGLRVDQRICLWVQSDGPTVSRAARQFERYLAEETLAADIRYLAPPAGALRTECRLDRQSVRLGLRPVELGPGR